MPRGPKGWMGFVRTAIAICLLNYGCFRVYHVYNTGVHKQLETEHSQLKTDLLEAQETCQVSE